MLHTTYSQKGKFKQIDETSGGEQEHAFFSIQTFIQGACDPGIMQSLLVCIT